MSTVSESSSMDAETRLHIALLSQLQTAGNLYLDLTRATDTDRLAITKPQVSALAIQYAKPVLDACWTEEGSNNLVDIAAASPKDLTRYSDTIKALPEAFASFENSLVTKDGETQSLTEALNGSVKRAKSAFGKVLSDKDLDNGHDYQNYLECRSTLDNANSLTTSLDACLSSLNTVSQAIEERTTDLQSRDPSKGKKMKKPTRTSRVADDWAQSKAVYDRSLATATNALQSLAERIPESSRKEVATLASIMRNLRDSQKAARIADEELLRLYKSSSMGCFNRTRVGDAVRLMGAFRTPRRPSGDATESAPLGSKQEAQVAPPVKRVYDVFDPGCLEIVEATAGTTHYGLALEDDENPAVSLVDGLSGFAKKASASFAKKASASFATWCFHNALQSSGQPFEDDPVKRMELFLSSDSPDHNRVALNAEFSRKRGIVKGYRALPGTVGARLRDEADSVRGVVRRTIEDVQAGTPHEADIRLAGEALHARAEYDSARLSQRIDRSDTCTSTSDLATKYSQLRTRVLESELKDVLTLADVAGYVYDYEASHSEPGTDDLVPEQSSQGPGSGGSATKSAQNSGKLAKKDRLALLAPQSPSLPLANPSTSGMTWAEFVRSTLPDDTTG